MREHLSWTANLKLDDYDSGLTRSVVAAPWSSEESSKGKQKP
jgi:hypothetical protein